MQKIKIVSNTPIKKPQSLENIDISYGISYYSTYDSKIQTIENQWGYKALSNITKVFQKIMPSFNNSNLVTNQVLEDSKFLMEHQKENADNLMIQISHNSLSSRVINTLTMMNIFRKINFFEFGDKEKKLMEIDDIRNATNTKNAFIYHQTKDMFLGTSFFNSKTKLFRAMKEKFTEKEAVSFVFFHEFSHACELENNMKYGRKLTESSFDNFLPSLILMSNYQNFAEVRDELKKKYAIGIPDHRVMKTLKTLHQEIYADVGSLLLLRNKMIVNGNYKEKDFLEKVTAITIARKNEQVNGEQDFVKNGLKAFYYHDHFTSPGVEHLLDKIKGNTNLLSEKDMHELTGECVNIGVGKTVLAMVEADNNLVPQFKVLFSLKLQDGKVVMDESKNHYKDAIDKILEITPKEWIEKKDQKIKELNEKGLSKIIYQEDILFNACLNENNAEPLLEQQKEIQENMCKSEVVKNIQSIRKKLTSIVKSNTKTLKM